ncbi:DUF2207 domain-containing protein [Microbacterium murale]|uniref:DUF2207 domain-containing protein n=1 Tax=Microbacterium murale TaxID=1081040 RepID=A0ABU0P524_9MICO|nr:DUF2207 domain-containing protein [Microbacterium murale]MDQ0642437.1 hypothetical protein [Microbacterium murale]
MSALALSVIVIVLVPAAILLTLAIVARVQSHRFPKSPGPRFAPTEDGVVLRDALLLNQDRRAVAAGLVDLAVRRKIRLLRPNAPAGARKPIAVETVEGASFHASEIAILEALFGRESSSTRVRRLSADSRSLARRVRTVLDAEEQKGVAARLFGARRCTWPVVLLRIFAVGGVASSLFFMPAAGGADLGVDWGAFAMAAAALAMVIAVFFS